MGKFEIPFIIECIDELRLLLYIVCICLSRIIGRDINLNGMKHISEGMSFQLLNRFSGSFYLFMVVVVITWRILSTVGNWIIEIIAEFRKDNLQQDLPGGLD